MRYQQHNSVHQGCSPLTRAVFGGVGALTGRATSEVCAERRLADEYDAAQERGEVRGANERTTSSPEAVGVTDIGLTHKDIHEDWAGIPQTLPGRPILSGATPVAKISKSPSWLTRYSGKWYSKVTGRSRRWQNGGRESGGR